MELAKGSLDPWQGKSYFENHNCCVWHWPVREGDGFLIGTRCHTTVATLDSSPYDQLLAELSILVVDSLRTNAAVKHNDMQLTPAQLLLILGPSGSVLLDQSPAQLLFQDCEQLEMFLGAGEYSVSDSSSPSTREGHWCGALGVLVSLIEHEPEAPADHFKLRLAVVISLAFASPHPNGWMSQWIAAHDAPGINPIERYDLFVRWAVEEILFDTFVSSTPWAVRHVVGSWAGVEEMIWDREHCRRRRCFCGTVSIAERDNVGGELVHGMVGWKMENPKGVNSLESPAEYYDFKPVTLQLVRESGGVCGQIATFGTVMAQAYCVPAILVSQPGHCAFL